MQIDMFAEQAKKDLDIPERNPNSCGVLIGHWTCPVVAETPRYGYNGLDIEIGKWEGKYYAGVSLCLFRYGGKEGFAYAPSLNGIGHETFKKAVDSIFKGIDRKKDRYTKQFLKELEENRFKAYDLSFYEDNYERYADSREDEALAELRTLY